MEVVHFANSEEFRRWLQEHHAKVGELQVAFYKKSSGKTGLTYFEAVEQALCFGWIDGIVRRLDEERFTHRFTPRRPGSTWSLINVAKVEALLRAGRMQPAGVAAYKARQAKKTGIYSYEQARTSAQKRRLRKLIQLTAAGKRLGP